MSPWILAARPKTLVAGAIPVALGSSLALRDGHFEWLVFFCALFGALCIQIGTNYVNDAADFEKGADTQKRLGPARMAAMGLLSPRSLYIGAGVSFAISLLFGSYLIYMGGVGILFLGLVSLVCAVAYTAGPFPLAYLGLGDLFVLLFFGLAAVVGTYFSHTHQISTNSIFLALCTGLQGVTLIAVNNLRDIPTDKEAGKKTLSVRLGDVGARFYCALLVILSYFFWLPLAEDIQGLIGYLPFLSIPLAVSNIIQIFRIRERSLFNSLLGRSALLQLLFGFLACLSLALR